MKTPAINSLMKLWEGLSRNVEEKSQLQTDLDIYKKLLQFFQVGDYYYIIFNINIIDLNFVSPGIEKVLGYKASDVNLAFWLSLIHPEDQVWLSKFEQETAKFMYSLPTEKLFDYKIQYDLRFRTKKGQYRRILMQLVTLDLDDVGKIHRTISIHTDITHLKPQGEPKLSFIALNGDPSFIDIQVGKPLTPFKEKITKREREVLLLIIMGKSNKEIAEELFVSKQTIDKHRKNMLAKTQCKNSAELIATAIKNGWV